MRSIGDGWMVGLGDPVGLFQSWRFYDSMNRLEIRCIFKLLESAPVECCSVQGGVTRIWQAFLHHSLYESFSLADVQNS